MRGQDLWLAHQHQRGIRMRIQKSQASRERNSGTDIPTHGVDSNPDHDKNGEVKNLTLGKRKARRMSAGQVLKREIRLLIWYSTLCDHGKNRWG
ncbi:MAG: hypothetical protein MUP33_05545 [Polaromonas sp.]|nr:hypothetical protein [Polaromonas sp.]